MQIWGIAYLRGFDFNLANFFDKTNQNVLCSFLQIFCQELSMDLSSPLKKKKNLQKKLQKLLKQQDHHEDDKHYQPGKVDITSTNRCRLKVVNFFGDIHTEVYCLSVSPDHENVAVGCSTGDVKVYNIFEGKIILMGNSSRLSGYPNTGIRWNPKNPKQFVACNCDGAIKWYNTDHGAPSAHFQSQTGYLCTDFSCDGSWTVFGNEKHQLQLFDGPTKKLMLKYEAGNIDSLNPNHTNRIFSVKGLKNDPNLFFSGGWDASVRLWDVRVPETSVRKFGGPMVSADSLDLKNNVLLAGNYSTQDIYQFWDFTSGKLIKTVDIKQLSTTAAYCFAASYAHNSKYKLSAGGFSGINKLKIFEDDMMIGQIKMQASPLCLNFYRYNDKDFMIASGVQGTIYAIKVKILEN